jgi:hypothetical protein
MGMGGAAMSGQWQSISEAPKDETRVLLLVSGRDPVVIGKWSPFRSQWFFESSRRPHSVTHWRPLPAPPGKEAP